MLIIIAFISVCVLVNEINIKLPEINRFIYDLCKYNYIILYTQPWK